MSYYLPIFLNIGNQLAQSFEETLSTFEQSRYKDW